MGRGVGMLRNLKLHIKQVDGWFVAVIVLFNVILFSKEYAWGVMHFLDGLANMMIQYTLSQ